MLPHCPLAFLQVNGLYPPRQVYLSKHPKQKEIATYFTLKGLGIWVCSWGILFISNYMLNASESLDVPSLAVDWGRHADYYISNPSFSPAMNFDHIISLS